MTTRRDILKGGAGLAAILATGKASAAFIKSMIAARQTFIGRGGKSLQPQLTFTISGSSFVSASDSLGLTTDDGSPLTIDWGDGIKTTVNSGSSLGNHTYATSGTYVAKVYSNGVITRIEKRCFYQNKTLVDIEIPSTVVYLGQDSIRECGLTEFIFQRQFTYGSWPLWGNHLYTAIFNGKFRPGTIQTIPSYWNGSTIILGPSVLDSDIQDLNQSFPKEYQGISDVGVDVNNQYFDVRGEIRQIVRKSDNALVLITYSLVGGVVWTGQGIDPSVRKLADGITQDLKSTTFTVPEGIKSLGGNFCRDSSTLTTVDIPSTAEDFGIWPFYNSPNITTINCAANTPPVALSSVGSLPTSATVHVPTGRLAVYQASSFWSRFSSIVDDL